MNSIIQYIPASFLAVGAAITWWAGTPKPVPLVRPLAQTVPAEFLGAVGKDVTIGADEVQASGVSDYINRNYDVGGISPIGLYVGYHATQQGDKRMHSPTLCLPGSGWTPVGDAIVTVPINGTEVAVNRYILQKDHQQILVYYWFQGRGRITTGQAELKINAIKDALLTHRDEEALVRVVVPVGSKLLQAPVGSTGLPADSVAMRLASAAIPAVERALPPAP